MDKDISNIRFRHNTIRLSPRDVEVFEKIKEDVFAIAKQKNFDYIQKLTYHIEDTFRLFLFVTSSAIFSSENIKKHLPEKNTVSYAIRNLKGMELTSYENIFFGFTRPQFRNVFTQKGTDIKTLIVDCIDLAWPVENWDTFFDIYNEENIVTSHNKLDQISISKSNRYITYSNLSQEVIGSLNHMIAKLINDYFFIIKMESYDDINLIDFHFGFCFQSKNEVSSHFIDSKSGFFRKSEHVATHKLTPESLKRVEAAVEHKLQIKPYIIENLLLVENIQSHYAIPFMDFYLALGYLYHIKKSIVIQPWTGSRIIIRRASSK